MMKIKKLLFCICLVIMTSSCSKDDVTPEPAGAYSGGIFVLNEGNFGSGNSSVTYINQENGQTENNIFKKVNGNLLGDTAQSMTFNDELALIILNVSNKIEIVDRNTFESMGTISEYLSNPRYAVIVNDKIFVSNWGDGNDPEDDFIAVFELKDFSFTENIEVAEGPETIAQSGNTLFVAHAGGYSFNNIVSVIDAGTDSLTKEVAVGDVPNSMVISGNYLWVLSSGKPNYADAETGGKLSKIDLNTKTVTEDYDFPEAVHPDHLTAGSNSLYYSVNKSIFEFDNNSDSLSEIPVFTVDEASFLYGFSINDNKAYIASPNADFTGNGKLYVYDLSAGSLLNQYVTGINPNSTYFN